MGGRARLRHLFPFVTSELEAQDGDYSLSKILCWGLLPPVWLSESPEEDLVAYCGTYLKEEIQAEALVRNLIGFSRFLTVAGLSNGTQLNYEALAKDCGVPARHGKSRKPVATSKLYFFDGGVARVLAGRPVPQPGSAEWGLALEHLIFQELRAWLGYRNSQQPLCYWRTVDQREVDFIVGDELAIEVKAAARINDRDLKGLRDLAHEATFKNRLLVCQEPEARMTEDGILILPVKQFLARLWLGEWE